MSDFFWGVASSFIAFVLIALCGLAFRNRTGYSKLAELLFKIAWSATFLWLLALFGYGIGVRRALELPAGSDTPTELFWTNSYNNLIFLPFVISLGISVILGFLGWLPRFLEHDPSKHSKKD